MHIANEAYISLLYSVHTPAHHYKTCPSKTNSIEAPAVVCHISLQNASPGQSARQNSRPQASHSAVGSRFC